MRRNYGATTQMGGVVERILGNLENHLMPKDVITLRLSDIAMENPPFEDVFPIQDGDFPLLCLFTRGYIVG